ncbi:MAG: tetratricopeptide repeat protein, partial [Methyloprofundus sp.]|nr:tetratricopeptide repeat protein [Methyloprofundus sp.]
KAKLRLTSTQTTLDDLIIYFRNKTAQGTQEQRAAMQYGLGLCYVKQQKFQQAEVIFRQLSKQYPMQRQYLTALAQAAVNKRDTESAKKLYLQLQQNFPGDVEFQLEYISILLKSNQNQLALQHLKLIDYKNQRHPQFLLLLAQAYGNLAQDVNSHRYMAEYYYAIGQTNAAIMQIKIAQKDKDLNFYLSAILEDRLNFFVTEMQALKELQE